MAEQIGVVKTIIGTATATGADGTVRNLQVGDRVFADELISTGPGGAIEVELADGSVMDLGRNSQIVLDEAVYNVDSAEVNQADQAADVDAIQAAILAGADPTEITDATAAGAGAGGEGNEGHEPVFVDYLAPEVTPDAGFETTGISVEFNDFEEELLGIEDPLPTISINDTHECEPFEQEYFYSDEIQAKEGFVLFQPDPNNHDDGIAVFTITLSEPSDQDVTVNFETADGTAIAGGDGLVGEDDYGQTSGTVVIPAGETEANVYVYVFGDLVVEGNETFLVNLSDPTNATIADGQGVGTIVDKSRVGFNISVTSEDNANDTPSQQATVTEDDTNDDVATFTITMDQNLASGVTASVDVSFGGDSDDDDFVSAAIDELQALADATTGVSFDGTTLSFDSDYDGTPLQFSVQVSPDDDVEGSEDLVATLSNPQTSAAAATAFIYNDTATVDIVEVDAAVSFNVAVASETDEAGTQVAGISEENDADDLGAFTFSIGGDALAGSNTASVTITASGSAEDADFESMTGNDTAEIIAAIKTAAEAAGLTVTGDDGDSLVVTWAAGDSTSFNVDLTAFDDDLTDSPEGLTLTLSAPAIDNGPTPTLTNTAATLDIVDTDAAVSFDINVASEDAANDTATQQATISEENNSDDLGTFTFSIGGDALAGSNTASVTITASGSAEDADFESMTGNDTAEIIAAIKTAAEAAGLTVTGDDGDSLVVTWAAGDSTSFNVDLTAFDDDLTDSPEGLTLTLSAPAIDNGPTPTLTNTAATLDIVDTDAAVSFDINVASEDAANDTATQQATISEENNSDDLGTFTFSIGGDALAGSNTASVTITASGSAEDADFESMTGNDTAEIIAAIKTAAEAAGLTVTGDDGDSLVVTWAAGDSTSFNVDLTAFDDDLTDSPEGLTLTLSAPAIDNGPTPTLTNTAATLDIVDTDAAVSFDINVASEDAANDTATQQATISEENNSDDLGTFTFSIGGDALAGSNTASVTITASGSAEDADFESMTGNDTAEIIAAIKTAAEAAGLTVTGDDGDSLVVTWAAGDSTSFNVDLTAFDDDLTDSPEGLTLTLSAPAIDNGPTPTLTNTAATLDIVDTDAAVSFDINVASEDAANDTATQQATISEENNSDDLGTFTFSIGGDALAGSNTASVTITASGSAEDADFESMTGNDTAEIIAAIKTAAEAAGLTVTGDDGDSLVVTWAAGDSTSFNVDLTAFDDDLTDSPEGLTLTLSAPAIDNGPTPTLTNTAATLDIVDTDAAVSFDINVASEDAANDTATQQATISEENNSDDLGTFTFSIGGDALAGSNTASVTITASGSAEDADFESMTGNDTAEIIAAIKTAAEAAGLTVTGDDGDSLVVTWAAGDSTSFNVDLTAFDDDLTDSPEGLTLTLSAPAIDNGPTPTLTNTAATLDIVDTDAAVSFDINVASEDAANDTATQQATISEENNSDDLGTFTFSIGGDALAGSNTASVTITASGSAEDADFESMTGNDTAEIIAAIKTAAEAAGLTVTGDDGDSLVVTWAAGDSTSFNVDLTAFDDDLTDSPEGLTLTLSAPAIDNGPTPTLTNTAATLDIVDTDAAVSFDINVASEDAANDTATQQATISEENNSDDLGTFTFSIGGDALAGSNTASVTITASGSAEDADFESMTGNDTAEIIAAIKTAAEAAGLTVTGDDGDSLVVTWAAGDTTSFDVDLTAFNDALTDSPEALTLTLSAPAIDNGPTPTLTNTAATLNIVDIDQAVTFALTVVSEDAADDTPMQQATITEENDADDLATFTITLGGVPLNAGNTASVNIAFTGSTADADFVTAALTSLQTVADATTGVSLTGNTLTFDSTFVGTTLNFSVEAFDDGDDEGPEDLIATLSTATIDEGSASITGGKDVATVDLLDNDADFPAGLAYSIAGGGGTGAFLYGLDLATGATFQIGAVVVDGNDKAQFSSLTLNPDDGFLYGLADQGNLNGFARVNPATGEAQLLFSNSLFNTSTSGMSFDVNGDLYIGIDDEIYLVDAADVDENMVFTDLSLVASFNNGGVAIDSMAFDGVDTIFFVSGSQVYTMTVSGGTGQTATALPNPVGDTIDGLSFDENGTLWGADNLGTIYSIDTTTGIGTLVATISNSDVTNSGIHSLAISQLLPGTYVTIAEDGESHTEFYPFDAVLQSDSFNSAQIEGLLGGSASVDSAINIDITGRTISVTQTDTSDPVDSVAVRVDASADITVDGFDQTDVFTRDGDPSNVIITNAEGGTIQTGEAADTVDITAATPGGVVPTGETFTVDTDGGDDIITLHDLVDSSYIINAGEALDGDGNLAQDAIDVDTVVIDGSIDLGSGPLDLSNVEIVDITGTGDNTLTLSAADVLDASDDTNTLIVQGDSGDALDSSDAWAANGTAQGVDGVTYDVYESGLATILVDSSAVDVSGLS